MEQTNKHEVIYSKMEKEDTFEENPELNTKWSKRETIQVTWYFIIAFVMLFAFGYLINRFLL